MRIIRFASIVVAVTKNPIVLTFQELVPSLNFHPLNLTWFGSCPEWNCIMKLLMKTCKVPVCN